MSFQTDRLLAISAVASVVGKATGDRYLAGIWRNGLLSGLIWVAGGSLEDDPSPHQRYIAAPTWSWASYPSWTYYYTPLRGTPTRHLRASVVLDAWTALEGPNPYGAVSDAAIVLSGHHCDAELTIPERGLDGQLDFGHGDVQTVRLGSKPFQFRALDFMRVEPDINADRHHGNARYLRRATDRRSDPQPACSGTVHLLWLEELVLLILTPSCRKGKEEGYERLGILLPSSPFSILKMPEMVKRSSIELV